MRVLPLVVAVLLPLLVVAGVCPAQERRGPSSRSARAAAARRAAVAPKPVENPPAPVLSGDAGWVRDLLIGFAALVLAGVVVGPLYRAIVPEEQVPTHSHDEPPGASHRHGPSGERVNPSG
jgi:hypothetical protein